ncbi:RNA recognition motif domain-containing protein [Phthorimaea operculella]|nr:RNA recognition motif domain-containing protein [Phthorimaea operculella]
MARNSQKVITLETVISDLFRTEEARPAVLSMVKKKPIINEDVPDIADSKPKNKRTKLNKTALIKALVPKGTPKKNAKTSPTRSPTRSAASPLRGALADPTEKYPVLKDQALVQKFLKVDFTNNQKAPCIVCYLPPLRGALADPTDKYPILKDQALVQKFLKCVISPPLRGALADPTDKYPVLKDQALVQKFLKVDFTNNQKGRIRQVLKDILRGTSPTIMPEVINNKIQAILKSSENLTDTDLRKIRVLYNMLKKATEEPKKPTSADETEESLVDESKIDKENSKKNKQDKKSKDKGEKDKKGEEKDKKGEVKDKPKKKAPKRYVVFVGNLPLKVTRDQILSHFEDIREYIKDVRIPQVAEDKKSSYAYVEFDNAPVYEMALSKHHSMMGSKRINVLYTTHHNSKLTKTEAKAKSAKLVAMSKKGTLIGSVPLNRKRSARRAKARKFQKQAQREMEDREMLMKPRKEWQK